MGRKSKANLRKPEILEHFYQVLNSEGFENVSIAKVAQHMDVNPSLLIHYFHTKEAMVVEFVDYLLHRYETALVQELQSQEQPQQRLEIVLNLLFGPKWTSLTDPSAFYACYYLALRNAQVLERFQTMYLHFKQYLLKEIHVWQTHQLLKPNLDPDLLADYLIAQFEGLLYYGHIQQNPQQFAQQAQFIQTIIRNSFFCPINPES